MNIQKFLCKKRAQRIDVHLLLLILFSFGCAHSYAQKLPDWTDEIAISKQEELDGQTIILTHYFATWCKPCMEELPVFDCFIKENPTLVVRFICLDLENTPKLSRSIHKLRLPGEVYYLAPTNEHITHISRTWDGTLPFTSIRFPGENTSIELSGKQTSQSLQQLLERHEN